MYGTVFRVVVATAWLGCMASAMPDTTVELESVGLRLRLPQPDSLRFGSWSMGQYSTADVYSFRLGVPEPVESSALPNAVSATYGDSLHLFVGVVPEFLTITELFSRLLDMHQLQRSARTDPPVMFTQSRQRMFGAVPVEEAELVLRDTTRSDSILTLIASGKRGSDAVVYILRSRRSVYGQGSWLTRFLATVLASVEFPRLLNADTMHLVHPGQQWQVIVPMAWMNTIVTQSQTMPVVPTTTDDDTVWNTVVVRLPLVQIEYTVVPTTLSDTAITDYTEHISGRYGLESSADLLDRRGPIQWRWYFARSPRRGDIVQTTYGIAWRQGRVAVIRLTAWASDMPHVERIIATIAGALQW
ncbi:MAG: hypothetical protein N2663_08165 [Chlorobi bacterium]|nr:hypothetical protein [Chlorobiota bacterium]